jgi:ribosomal protein L30/L7E
MPVTLHFANAVRRLGRVGMNVEEIAATLGRPEANIMETLRMLGLPLPGECVEFDLTPSPDERAALRDRIPKRWQDKRNR